MSTSAAPRVRIHTNFNSLTIISKFYHARSGTTMQMQRGQIVLTPYAVVEQLLAMGNVELI